MRASTPDKSRTKLARTVQARSTRAYQRLSPAERRTRNKILYARAKKRYQVLSLDEKRAHDEKKSARAKKHYYVLSLDEGRARRLASRERSCAKDHKHDNTRKIARVAAKKACREIAKLHDCVRCASHLALHVSPRAHRVTNWGGSARAAAKG